MTQFNGAHQQLCNETEKLERPLEQQSTWEKSHRTWAVPEILARQNRVHTEG